MYEDPEKTREQLLDITAKIRAVLAHDLRDFPIRTAKKRYLALPEFAATLTAEQLGNLKASLNTAAEARTQEILEKLSAENIWIDNVTPSGAKPSKTLRENRAVSEALTGITQITRDTLAAFGFPEELLDIHYDPPTWFITTLTISPPNASCNINRP